MKKSLIIIFIYLLVLSVIPALARYRSDKQKEIVIQGFYESYYHYFDMYEFFLRQYLGGTISEEALEEFIVESISSNHDLLILNPQGAVVNNIDNIRGYISPSALESIIITTIQNPLVYFAQDFSLDNQTFILTARKITISENERWSLIVISDISNFIESWTAQNRGILTSYIAIWTLFFAIIIYYYFKKRLYINQKKMSSDLMHFVHNIIKNDDNSLVLYINAESEILGISRKLALLLDYKEEYLIGKSINYLINDFKLSSILKPSKIGEELNNEINIHDKIGNKFIFLMAPVPHFVNITEIESVVIILFDITPLRDSINRLDFEVKKNVSLSTIAQLVMSVNEHTSIMKLIIEEAMNLIDFDYGTIYIIRDEYLYPFYSNNPQIADKMDTFSIKIGDGLSGLVAKTGMAQIVNDASNNSLTLLVPGTTDIPECIMCAPLINNEGELIGVITFSRESLNGFLETDLQILELLAIHTANIFDKTALLNKIIEDEKRHNALINESALAILILYEKNIIFCNGRFCDLIKYEKENLLGRNITDFISQKDSSFFISQLTTFTMVGKTEIFEYEFLTSDNKSIILEFSLSSITWDGKTSILASANDVTEKIELNKRMLQTQKLESIGTLTSGIAHDFKNILSGIVGAVELILLSAEEGTRIKNMAKTIKLSADRAVKLSQRLLGFSRIVEDEFAMFEINNLLRETLDIISYTFDKNIDLETDFTSDPLYFEGDSVKIQQCVMNICVNARDVMPQGGKLIIRTKLLNNFEKIKSLWPQAENRNYTCIEIVDSGPGIPEHIQELLFEPFFTTKSKEKGTGLGLSITKSIIDEYKGTITLKSKLNQGTTFFILLPWLPEIKKHEDSANREGEIQSHVVLLVDDEEIVLDIAKDLLEELGSTVYASSNGFEALKMIDDHPEITLALIDRMMPKIDGLTLLKKMKEKKPEIKVIVASGFLQENIVKEFMDNGAQDCITKPYRLEQLSNILRDV